MLPATIVICGWSFGEQKCVKLEWEFKNGSTDSEAGSFRVNGRIRGGRKEVKTSIRPERETPQRDGSLGGWSRFKHSESSIPSVRDLSEEEAALAPLFGPIWGLRGHIPLGRINLQRPACNEWLTVKSRLLIYSLCSQNGLLVSSTARGKSPIAPEATSLSGKIAWACRTLQGAGCMKTNYTKVA